MATPVAPSDLTWLNMDRPNNLMNVNGVLWLAAPPDWDAVEEVLRDRIVKRFPVFSRRASQVDGTWVWEDDPDFSLDNHLRRVTLAAPGTLEQAKAYLSARVSEPFNRARPLWEVSFIDGLDTSDGGPAAMVGARFHHAIADGIRLVQVLLSLLDPLTEQATPSRVGRSGSRRGPVEGAARVAKHAASGTADLVASWGATLVRSPAAAGQLGAREVAEGARMLRQHSRLVDTVTGVASEDNKLVNTWRSLGRLTLSGRSVDTIWSGTPGVEKTLSWVSGLPLAEIRRVGKAHEVSVNDVLLAAVSLGVTEYLADKGESDVDQLNWLVPVSLKPIDAELPKDLGNHFALVMLPMPLGVEDPHRLLVEMRTRMNRIKNSAEPAIVFGVQRAIAQTPAAVSVRLTNLLANKSVGLLTNVPGPRGPMALAGTEVTGVLGWVPTSGDQPLGLCIFSYNGSVNIGIASDAELIPDPDVLASHIEHAVHELAAAEG